MQPMNLHQMPYTCRGSYMVLSHVVENYQGRGNSEGLYLRTIHNSANTPLIAKVSLQLEGMGDPQLDGTALHFDGTAGSLRFCFADAQTLLIQGSAGAGLQLDFLTECGPYDYIYELEHQGQTLYMANCYKNNNRYLIYVQEGCCQLDQRWEESSSLYSRLNIGGEKGFLCMVKEIETEWDQHLPHWDFDAARQRTEQDLQAYLADMPALAPAYQQMGRMAGYLNWSSIVRPDGFLKREAMYMSKNWMTNVWSWDHCFNALALAYGQPELAWDEFMIMADFQDASGRLPDSISDSKIIWNYCKPPVHGWALRRMLRHMTLTADQTRQAYDFLDKWTCWWMNYRRHNGLYYYNHGNDSGWDNATAFAVLPPVATPELQADMIVQMQVLADLAAHLGMNGEAARWQQEAQTHLALFLDKCFRDDLPVAIQCATGEIVECQSLLPYEVLVLGESLPLRIREAIIQVLKSDRFLTAHGFATESPASPLYRDDGYWRGPIWAPSTMLLVDGLDQCGEMDFAREIARRFADMVCLSGFAENFDAKTGAGLRDLAYTWTASVAIVLAKDYLTDQEG